VGGGGGVNARRAAANSGVLVRREDAMAREGGKWLVSGVLWAVTIRLRKYRPAIQCVDHDYIEPAQLGGQSLAGRARL